MTERFGLKESVIERIQSVLSRYPQVERATLYGSRAKGNYKTGSDIDLALIGGDDLTLRVLSRILNELDDLLLPYMFDVFIFALIDDPAVREHIQRVGKVFYEKVETSPLPDCPPKEKR